MIDVYCDSYGFGVDEWLWLFVIVCEVVVYVYYWGVVYCDFKLSNIYVCDDGMVKLLDFGIVK